MQLNDTMAAALAAAALLWPAALAAAYTPMPPCNLTQLNSGCTYPLNITKCDELGPAACGLPSCSSVTPTGVCLQQCTLPPFPPNPERRLMAWVGGDVDNQVRSAAPTLTCRADHAPLPAPN